MVEPLRMVMKDATRMRLPSPVPYTAGQELIMEYRNVGHRNETKIERYAVVEVAGVKQWQPQRNTA